MYLDTRTRFTGTGENLAGSGLWVYRSGWSYALAAGAGRYLVAERWNDPHRGAKLTEFDLQGRVAEYRFPEVIANDRALGAMHIELLADQCTVLYTLGNDDPAGNRVRRLNICTSDA